MTLEILVLLRGDYLSVIPARVNLEVPSNLREGCRELHLGHFEAEPASLRKSLNRSLFMKGYLNC